MSRSRVKYACIALATSALVACANAGPEDEPTGDQGENVLAVVHGDDGHEFKLLELGGGTIALFETAKQGTGKASFDEDLSGLKPSEIYAKIAKGAAVPTKVLEADERFVTQENEPVTPPPEVESAQGKGPSLYSDADQAWFRANYCVNAICLQFWDYIVTPAYFYKWMKFVGFVNPGGNASNLIVSQWNGRKWVPFPPILLQSGQVGWASVSYPTTAYWMAEMHGVVQQLSIAVSGPFAVKDGPRK